MSRQSLQLVHSPESIHGSAATRSSSSSGAASAPLPASAACGPGGAAPGAQGGPSFKDVLIKNLEQVGDDGEGGREARAVVDNRVNLIVADAKVLEELWTGVTPTGAYWNPTRVVSDNRIPALANDTTAYTFAAPPEGDVTIEVTLIPSQEFIAEYEARADGMRIGAWISTALAAACGAAALGLSAVFRHVPEAYLAVKLAGAAYLVYLGLRAIFERPATEAARAEPSTFAPPRLTAGRALREAALAEVLNPKSAVFFLAFLPQFVRPENGAVTLQLAVLGVDGTQSAQLARAAEAVHQRLVIGHDGILVGHEVLEAVHAVFLHQRAHVAMDRLVPAYSGSTWRWTDRAFTTCRCESTPRACKTFTSWARSRCTRRGPRFPARRKRAMQSRSSKSSNGRSNSGARPWPREAFGPVSRCRRRFSPGPEETRC